MPSAFHFFNKMKRSSLIKFIGGNLLMVCLSGYYTLYALFRVLLPKIRLFFEKSFFSELHKIVSSSKITLLFFDLIVVFSLMFFLWYFLIEFIRTLNKKYFYLFFAIFSIAVFYYFISPLTIPNNFCEKYDYAVICPSFCGVNIKSTPIPEDYSTCVSRKPVLENFGNWIEKFTVIRFLFLISFCA